MSLSIIYAVISRNRKIILTDYTEYGGNFQQATLKLLSKIEKDSVKEVQYSSYTVFFEDINDVTFMLIGENIKTEVAFSFLSDMKKKFFSQYDDKKIQNSFSYYLREFTSEIKTIVRFYEDNQTYVKPDVLTDKNGRKINVEKKKIEDFLPPEEIIDIKSEKVKKTNDAWDDYKITVNTIKKKKRAKMIKLGILCLLTFIIAFCLMYLILK